MKRIDTSISGSDEVNYQKLAAIEEQAIRAQRNRDYECAVQLWSDILAIDPHWGHGAGYLSLADCLEQLGQIREARSAYLRALTVEKHPMYLGAYASHLYLYGSDEEALSAYLKYIQLEAVEGADDSVFDKVSPALVNLGRRLGRSEASIKEAMLEVIQAGRRGESPLLSELT